MHSRFWRRLAFRLAAVIVGLMPFVLAEVTLRVFDLGRPDRSDDPFVGFRAVHPLFVLSVSNTLPGIFASFSGFLDIHGEATATANIPNAAALVGFPFSVAAVTYDTSGITYITNGLKLGIHR